MEMVRHLVPVVIAISLAAVVLSVGLDATLGDVTSVFRHPLRLIAAVAAVNLAPPLVAAVLIAIFPLDPSSKAALMLMAVSPAPPFVPSKELKVGGHRAYAYGVYVALAVLAVVIVPAMVEILARVYRVPLSISPVTVAGKVMLGVLMPLAVGLAIRRRAPAFAERAAPLAAKIGMALVLVVALPILILLWPKLAGLAGDGTIAAAVLMVAAALVAGHLLGGPDLQDRAALAVTAATRHPGIALMIATASAAEKTVSLAIILVLLAGLVAVIPYQMWLKRRLQREGSAGSL